MKFHSEFHTPHPGNNEISGGPTTFETTCLVFVRLPFRPSPLPWGLTLAMALCAPVVGALFSTLSRLPRFLEHPLLRLLWPSHTLTHRINFDAPFPYSITLARETASACLGHYVSAAPGQEVVRSATPLLAEQAPLCGGA